MAKTYVPPRGRIPVSDSDRTAARARMDGEKTKQASEAAVVLNQPVALMATEPAAPAVVPTRLAAPVATELVTTVVEPTFDVTTAPATEAALDLATTTSVEPIPVATAPAPTKPVPQSTVTVAPGRRGRKPTMITEQGVEPPAVRSVKIRETVWGDIKLLLALLPKEENTPRNIQSYVEAAHQHYEAHLRKQGKLPAK
ncbi:hypothetical protein [Hymenobacter bucti]|uniref:DUF3408 domain-containing protein n=1 Tax=Hymenobacter bucti TaxID=1844114 RepID=A0ABW4R1K2_9BACT